MKSTEETGRFRRLVGLLRPYRGRWAVAALALVLGGLVNLALPQAVRVAIDGALAESDAGKLDTVLLVAFVGFVVLAGLVFLRAYLTAWVGGRVVADLRERTFGHLLRQPPSFFHERTAGEVVSRLTSDIEALSYAVGAELAIALRSALTISVGFVLLFWTSAKLSLVMVAVFPPLALGAVYVGRRIRKRSKEIQDILAEANSGLKEAVSGIETVQTFRAEPYEEARYGRGVLRAFEGGMRVALARSGFVAGAQLGMYGAIAVILWFGGRQVLAGTLSGGELASFLLYTLLVTGAIVSLAELWANLHRAVGATTRIFELLEEEPAIRDAPDARALHHARGALAFENVSFAYPGRPDVTVLSEVSFRVEPGETVALVGPSGAGKSTIAKLVHRFYDPREGRVTVDGEPLPELRIESLRSAIATVHQDPVIFSGTIAENVRYGAPGAPQEAVERAAREANVADFVSALPDGYDTLVGERGVKLSGGERQRLAIARALLHDPRILILDEATSHLDTENEAAVQEALRRLVEGRATLVIAHRLSTVRDATRILVLDAGRIVESGSHDELMASGTIYPRLVGSQDVLR